MAKTVYTDVAFANNQEIRVRKILMIALWAITIQSLGWSIALHFINNRLNSGGVMNFVSGGVMNFAIAALGFFVLKVKAELNIRPLTHIVWWMAFAYIWLAMVLVEGVSQPHQAVMNLWFIALVLAGLLVLIREGQLIVRGYAALAFASFLLAEFAIFKFAGVFANDADAKLLGGGVNRVALFVTVTLLTKAWLTEVLDAEGKLVVANNMLEELLENMLPKTVSERLRREGKTFADGVTECSVLFVDIVGFTKLSADMQADDLVRMLDDIFSKFDDLTSNAGLEKIKTIGDSYMVAAGIPVPREDHASALVQLAFSLHDVIKGFNLHLRCGINSGYVVAGVIGKKRFVYDLWGDTVNVASRMESQGVVDEIQVTQSTASLIEEDFQLIPRGAIPIKGKGELPVFLVSREKVAPKIV